MSQDEEHLKLLSIFHYVAGGLTGFFSCFPIIHLTIGIAMLAGAIEGAPRFVGLILMMIALTFIAGGWTLAICMIVSGRRLARRNHYKFCFVIACISCLFMPYGTVLGVFTIIVLVRPTVKEVFGISP